MIKWLSQRVDRLLDRFKKYKIVFLFLLFFSSFVPQSELDNSNNSADKFNEYTQGEFTILLPKNVLSQAPGFPP